jgi:excisionase family DNA binding protein
MENRNSPSPAPALLGYDEAQKYLGGLSRSKLKALVASGVLKSLTIGRRRLLPVIELDRYVAERLAARPAQ